MSYTRFLEQLLETGSVLIETPDPPSEAEVQLGGEILAHFESSWRLEWSATAPRFDHAVASWAGRALYRSCQFLLYRDFNADEVGNSLAVECPEADTGKPQQHYNVDLTFRFLPNLWGFTQREAEDDPLTAIIGDWCFRWPLSSVGATNLIDSDFVESDLISPEPFPRGKFMIDEFWSHPSLAQGYVDRIIEHKDKTRIVAPEVRERILAVAGDHLELFETIQSKLLVREQIEDGI